MACIGTAAILGNQYGRKYHDDISKNVCPFVCIDIIVFVFAYGLYGTGRYKSLAIDFAIWLHDSRHVNTLLLLYNAICITPRRSAVNLYGGRYGRRRGRG